MALLERYGFLGGSLTASLVGTLGGLYLKKGDSIDYLVGGIAQECAESLKSRGLALGPIPWEHTAVLPHAPYGLKNLFDEWVEKAKTLKLLLHTQLCGCTAEGSKISDVSILNKARTGILSGKVFIDASGDGDLAYQAGAEMEGSPVQFPSMNFYMGNVNVAEAFAAGFSTLQRLIEDAIASGDYDLPRCGGAFITTMLRSDWSMSGSRRDSWPSFSGRRCRASPKPLSWIRQPRSVFAPHVDWWGNTSSAEMMCSKGLISTMPYVAVPGP